MELISVAIVVLVFLAMLVVGLDVTAHDFRQVARHPSLLMGATVAQFLLLPVLGVALVRNLRLEPGVGMTLALLAACPGGGISNYYTYLARANTALSITLTAVSNLAAVVTLPVVLGLLPRFLDARMSFAPPLAALLGQLLFVLTLPVVLGMGVRHLAPGFTARHGPSFRRLSLFGIAGLVVLVIAQGANTFASNWAEAAPVSALFVVASMAVGYGVGAAYHLGARDRLTVLIEFGVRNSALPTAMAVMVFRQFDLAVMVTIYFLTQISLMLLGILVYRNVPGLRYRTVPVSWKDDPQA